MESNAAAQGVSLNTARIHLKNILAKTNTNRQAEAIALILRSAAVLTTLEPVEGDTVLRHPLIGL